MLEETQSDQGKGRSQWYTDRVVDPPPARPRVRDSILSWYSLSRMLERIVENCKYFSMASTLLPLKAGPPRGTPRWNNMAKGRTTLEQHGQGHSQGFLVVRNQRVRVQGIVILFQLIAQGETLWCEARWMMRNLMSTPLALRLPWLHPPVVDPCTLILYTTKDPPSCLTRNLKTIDLRSNGNSRTIDLRSNRNSCFAKLPCPSHTGTANKPSAAA